MRWFSGKLGCNWIAKGGYNWVRISEISKKLEALITSTIPEEIIPQ